MNELDQDQGHLLHYAFAHKHLPEMAYEEPKLILGAALEGRLPTILNNIWSDMNSNIPEEMRREGQILSNLLRVDGGIMILVEMPAPKAPPEAVCVALVFKEIKGESDPVASCFALEQSYDDSFSIGYWAPDRTHQNFGKASGEINDFVHWVQEQASEAAPPDPPNGD